VGAFTVAALLLLLGIDLTWKAITCHSPSADWILDNPNISFSNGEKERKRDLYGYAALAFIGFGIVFFDTIKKWRGQDDLEKTWKKIVSDPEYLKHVHKQPQIYREDFKCWIAENHPHLKVWEQPPNSSN